VAGIVALAGTAIAQQQLAGIQGTIVDGSNAVVPDVVVTVKNLDTGVVRTSRTNERGVYRVPSLEPGRYEVSAEVAGFKKSVQTNVVLSVGATLGVNLTLQAGDVVEVIEVAAAAPDIQTERAEVSAVVTQKQVSELPLMSRNVLQLATLQPGINADLPYSDGPSDFLEPEQGVGIQASGQRGSAVSATMDGTNMDGGPWGGTVLMTPNVESVQEFRVISNNQSAEYGRNSGAAISIVTKGGTNTLHGSIYAFHRSEGLKALNYWERQAEDYEKPEFDRNDYGLSLGGPIRQDRSFFFVSFERLSQVRPSVQVRTVETQQFVDYVTSTRPNSIAATLLTTYRPLAYATDNLQDLGSPAPGTGVWTDTPDGIPDVGTASAAATSDRKGYQVNARLDHFFNNNKDQLRATYFMSRLRPIDSAFRPAFESPFPHRNHFLNLSHTHIFSNNTINELSFGYWRMHGQADDPTPESPTVWFWDGVADFGVTFWWPITFTQNNFQLKDNLTLVRGAHSFKAGAEMRLLYDYSVLHHWERPVYAFQNLLDFADDEPTQEERAVDPATGLSTTAPGDYRTREWALFIQDNWKIRPNLTLNLGLRYENFGNPMKSGQPFNGIQLGSGATMQEKMVNAKAVALDKLWNTDWTNFGPRLGFAWDPGSDAQLVIRGGGGITYNRINDTVFSDERLGPPQFAHSVADIWNGVPIVYSLGPNYPANPALGAGLDERGGIRGARLSLRVVSPDTKTPYAYNWFLGAQKQLSNGFVAEANYIGSAGRRLESGDGPGGTNYNRFAGDLVDGTYDGYNPSFGNIGLSESRVSSSYHGLTLQLSRRFQNGFGFQAAYTLGKARTGVDNPVEITRPDLDEGAAGHDVRHRIIANILAETPRIGDNPFVRNVLGGWQVTLITTWQTGTPFNIYCYAGYPTCDWNADGTTGDRPNAPADVSSLSGLSNDQYLNGAFSQADFPAPTAGVGTAAGVGTLGVNALYGPGYFNTDLSIFKNIQLPWVGGSDYSTLQLRFEIYNLFNRDNLGNPNTNWQSGTFGQSTWARNTREIQLGVKFIF